MRNFLLAILILVAGYWVIDSNPDLLQSVGGSAGSDSALINAYERKQNNVTVTGSGEVVTVLPIDRDGSKKQKFKVQVADKLRVLIIHDYDAAPLISRLKEGDTVEFSGQYRWNSQGGVVEYTHDDPSGLRWPGWIKHRGKKYE